MTDIYAIAKSAPGEATVWTEGALIRPEPWMQDSLCAQVDPELFFPEKGGSGYAARDICARCDVRAQCLEYALRTDQRDGIWGGTTEPERRRMRTGTRAWRVPADLDDRIRELNALGHSDASIARLMKVGPSTVTAHRTALGIPRAWKVSR